MSIFDGTTELRRPLEVLSEGYELPDGCDSFGLKSIGLDGRTAYEFLWPNPGERTGYYPLDKGNLSSCPMRPGDGLCVATDYWGMSSGAFSAISLLLVAYRSQDALGDSKGKLRVPQVAVVDRIDGLRFIREAGPNLDLRGARLDGADLRNASLEGMSLWESCLTGVNLERAYISGSDFRHAYLEGANLRWSQVSESVLAGATLRQANMKGVRMYKVHLTESVLLSADLRGACLEKVDLRGASLRLADLRGAELREVSLRGANLQRADLRGANLQGTDLSGAYIKDAKLPEGYHV